MSDAVEAVERRRVILASSFGTAFEWFDFFLYGSLVAVFGAKFFPPDNPTAGLLAALATFGVGFVIRPVGGLIFGRLGDRIGRKRVFLMTLILMGLATALMGVLPTYAQVGMWAPVLLVLLRLVQGLAVGGEHGGAATYVAEFAQPGRRAFSTSFIQATGTLGLVAALLVILVVRIVVGEEAFKEWGWRVPFAVSLLLLAWAVMVRMRLQESPLFQRLQAQQSVARAPLAEAFGNPRHRRAMWIALLTLTMAQGVVWHAGQYYPLLFMQQTLGIDFVSTALVICAGLLIGIPLFPIAGWLADRYGRRPILLIGFALSVVLIPSLFPLLAKLSFPGWYAAHQGPAAVIEARGCSATVFTQPASDCDRAREFLLRKGVPVSIVEPTTDEPFRATYGEFGSLNPDENALFYMLAFNGYPTITPAPGLVDSVLIVLVLVGLMLPVALVCAPAAAFVVELFPTQIRYTAMGLPYHIGNGWFGGFMPFFTTALGSYFGNVFAGLWYPAAMAALCLLLGWFLMPETRDLPMDRRE